MTIPASTSDTTSGSDENPADIDGLFALLVGRLRQNSDTAPTSRDRPGEVDGRRGQYLC